PARIALAFAASSVMLIKYTDDNGYLCDQTRFSRAREVRLLRGFIMQYPRCSRSARRGFTLIELMGVISILGGLIGLLLASLPKVREPAARLQCQNNLHQIALALQSYHNAKGALPPSYLFDPTLAGRQSGANTRRFDRPPPDRFQLPQGPGW